MNRDGNAGSEADSLLAASLVRLAVLDPDAGADVGRPTGMGWYALDDIVVAGRLDTWFDDLVAEHDGQRDVAGAYLGSWLADAIAGAAVMLGVVERRVPDLDAGLWLHRHPEGWFDRVAFASARVHVLASDPAADHRHAIVHDSQYGVWDALGAALSDALEPILVHIRHRSSYGLRGLWGGAADAVVGRALHAARLSGADGWAAWDQAQLILDAMALRQPQMRARPSPLPVPSPRGETLFKVKGTCCLYYKTHDLPRDPCGEGYCTTCPLRDAGDRLERLRRYLEASMPACRVTADHPSTKES